MNRRLLDPDTWDAIAAKIRTERDYHYDTSDTSHCIDLAQIVCEALNELNREQP